MTNSDIWLPRLSKKGFDIFNCYDRALLVSGCRKSGKTFSLAHKTWRHLWETPGARVGLFAKTIKSAKDGGVWSDMTNIIGPEWLGSEMVGMHGQPIGYTSVNNGVAGPKIDGNTRTPYFRIRNYWGGESELMLFSLDDEKEVEAKVKNLRFSFIWFSELSNFKDRAVFNISVMQLRMPHLKYKEQQWVADTNPAMDGKDSWIYKLWYEDRIRTDFSNFKGNVDKFTEWQKGIRLIECFLDDNPFLDHTERIELEGLYADDPGEFDRNVLGLWTKGKGGIERIFADIFQPEMHVIPDAIDIPKETDQLFTGWDIGATRNSAAVIVEKRIINGTSHYLVLDEHVIINEEIKTEKFAYDFYQKMLAIETFYNRRFRWVHWSDSSSLDVYRASIDGYDHDLVTKATEGQVELQGADKPNGSVEMGIKIMRRLIRENRLYAGENCPNIVKMLQNIEHGITKPVDDCDYKHCFDALRYIIYMEERKDVEFTQKPQSRSALVAIG